MRRTSPAFPVGLYGMLLFALAWLTLPGAFAPIERVLVGAVCSVARAWGTWFGDEAAPPPASWRERLQSLGGELEARLREHAVTGAPPAWALDLEPLHCDVVEVGGRRGGGGEPCELRLDHSYAELDGCSEVVTKGEALVGLLQRPGVGVASLDRPSDPARVVLPNHLQSRPLHAEVHAHDDALLRFVVRAAATVDPAPLRVELWDDPYRAARLDRTGLPVRTREVAGSVSPVPANLLLGTTRIWGYQRTDAGDALTLGVFLAPALAPRALSRVVVWRAARRDGGDRGQRHAEPRTARSAGVVHELPGAVHGRHLLVGAGAIADGAAVVHCGYLLGTARGLAFGVGLVTSFGASRHRWRLVLLPDEPQSPPIEFAGEVVRVDGDRVHVRRLDANVSGDGLHRPGHLFTGSNGPHCPAGVWIGRAAPAAHDLAELEVTLPQQRGRRTVEVHRARGRS